MVKEIGKSKVKLKKIKSVAFTWPNNICDTELDAIYFLHTNKKKEERKEINWDWWEPQPFSCDEYITDETFCLYQQKCCKNW